MTKEINSNQKIAVFGAYGHTGKFVVAELVKRGLSPVLIGRNKEKLNAISAKYSHLEIRTASIDNPDELDRAFKGTLAIINCAGSFLDTAVPIIEAALRMRIHYLDMAPEQQSVLDVYEKFSNEALDKGIVILPAMAFYGGLADLLASSAMGNWTSADTINIGIALDSWMPTLGTRLTGQRNTGKRLTYSNKNLEVVPNPLPTRQWAFSKPFGLLEVQAFPLSEIITISKHLQVNEINTYINLAPIQDIHNSETPPPMAIDELGRSSQIFVMEVEVSSGDNLCKAKATGQDIYAITAPIIVEAAIRIINGQINKKGVVAAGELFNAKDFLNSLSSQDLTIDILDN